MGVGSFRRGGRGRTATAKARRKTRRWVRLVISSTKGHEGRSCRHEWHEWARMAEMQVAANAMVTDRRVSKSGTRVVPDACPIGIRKRESGAGKCRSGAGTEESGTGFGET